MKLWITGIIFLSVIFSSASAMAAGSAAKGQQIYMANCIACHNPNPAQDGAIGPAIKGASMALVTARVMKGDYPKGYTPKRATRIMVPLPHLKANLADLVAFLK